MKIYVASSWRNTYYPDIIKMLIAKGHEVYDFRNPAEGTAFQWEQLSKNWKNWTAAEYRINLQTDRAKEGFNADFNAMKWADIGLLILPCGRSAHLELGWMAGAGKETIIYTRDGEEPELMAKLASHIVVNDNELMAFLAWRHNVTTSGT